MAPNGNVVRQRSGDIGPNTRVVFGFDGLKLASGQQDLHVLRKFYGSCKFKNSSDTGS